MEGNDYLLSLQTLQALSHRILKEMNVAKDAAKEKMAGAKRKAAKIKNANQASEVGIVLRTPMKHSSTPIWGTQLSARSHGLEHVDLIPPLITKLFIHEKFVPFDKSLLQCNACQDHCRLQN